MRLHSYFDIKEPLSGTPSSTNKDTMEKKPTLPQLPTIIPMLPANGQRNSTETIPDISTSEISIPTFRRYPATHMRANSLKNIIARALCYSLRVKVHRELMLRAKRVSKGLCPSTKPANPLISRSRASRMSCSSATTKEKGKTTSTRTQTLNGPSHPLWDGKLFY